LGFLCWPEERFDEAVSHARKAVQLAPGAADILNNASFILAPSGFPEEAMILACRLSGHIDEAIAAFEAYNARNPGFGLVDLAIAYREKDQADKAEDAAKRLMSARRDFTIAAWLKTQFRRDAARLEADVAALRMAGLPGG
ncbi:MAG: hypothetical protein WA439_17620, partial [Pseudolabrys sp.]